MINNNKECSPLCWKHERGVEEIFYNTPFRITENIGNNVFCFDKQKNTKIYIPSLITVDIIEFKSNIENYLKIWKKTVFREEKNWKIIEFKWLEKFIEIKSENQTIYIIDNHNHALYFRYKEYFAWNIDKWVSLVHMDQHTDMNENSFSITNNNLENIFDFTNNNCNVWNFIKPAVEEWLIWKITQINTEYSLLNIQNSPILGDRGNLTGNWEILDIDLDFRALEMSIEKYQETIDITKNLIQSSRVVTIATSPFFLDQKLAIKIIKDLLK